jgi:hypothetical protein
MDAGRHQRSESWADDKSKTGQADRSQVNTSERYEVGHLAEKFNVSPEKVREAEQKVGKSRQKIEEYLTKSK